MAQWIEDPQGRPEVEKVTKELKLPVWKANHKGKFRDFWNELWDKIEDYCIKLKEGTKKTDDRLNSAIGRNDGDFPIANAVVGDVYYSDVTKKYYKCKVGGPAPMPNGNFIDLSILENLNRLENLSNFRSETITIDSTNGILNQSFKLIAAGKIRIISFMNIFVKNDYETDYILPDWFLKNTEDVKASCANGTGGATGEVAEIHFEPSTKKLKFYPALRQGFSGNLQLSGQVISVTKD